MAHFAPHHGAGAAANALDQKEKEEHRKEHDQLSLFALQKENPKHVGDAADTAADAFIREFQKSTEALDLNEGEDTVDSLFQVIPIFLASAGTAADERNAELTLDVDRNRAMCRQIYDFMDHDGAGGGIDASDMKQALQRQGIRVNAAQAGHLIEEIDANGDGCIDFEEFFNAVQGHFVRKHQSAGHAPGQKETIGSMMAAKFAQFWGAFDKACPAARPAYAALTQTCKRVVAHPAFDGTIIICIMLIALTTVLELEVEDNTAVERFVAIVQYSTLAIFTFEVGIKIVAYGERPAKYFVDPEEGNFNLFDFTVVVLSYLMLSSNGAAVSVCRLLRLVKVMNKVPQLRVVLLGLVAGLRAVSSIMLLMLLVMFLFSICGNVLFGENDPAHFHRVETGILTLFQVSTLASWAKIFQINYFGCDKYPAGLYVQANSSEEIAMIQSDLGKFHATVCVSPNPEPVVATCFFFLYTVITAYVILSLFISVISAAMFEVIEMKKRQKSAELQLTQLSPVKKRERMIEELHRDDTPLRRHLESFFGMAPPEEEHPGLAQRASLRCFAISESPHFSTFIMLVICSVGILEVFDTNEIGGASARPILSACQLVFLFIFVCEACIKIGAAGTKPSIYFNDGWNRFDFAIVCISTLEFIVDLLPFVDLNSGGILVVLRLLRLLRVVRLLNSFPALQSVTSSLILAFSNVIYVMLMILIINFVFAVIAMLLFSKNDPQHFGRMSSALISIWMVETFDAWEELLYINMYGCTQYGYFDNKGFSTTKWACDESNGYGWVAALYLVFVAVLGGLILPTVLIGVISVAFEESTHRIKEEKKQARDQEKVVGTALTWDPHFVTEEQLFDIQQVFNLINFETSEDAIQTLEADELVPFLAFVCERYLMPLPEKKLHSMFDIVDVSGDNEVSWAEFLWFVLFLKKLGTNANGDSLSPTKGGPGDSASQRAARAPSNGAHGAASMAPTLAQLSKQFDGRTNEILDLEPSRADALYNLGVLRFKQGDVDGAEAAYRAAIAASQPSGLADAEANLGIMVGRGGDLEQAETLLRAAREHGAAPALAAARDEAEARARGETSVTVTVTLESDDDDTEVVVEKAAWWCESRIYPYNLGCVLEARGDLAGALTMYDEALVLDPTYARAKRNADQARARLAQGDQAAMADADVPQPPPTETNQPPPSVTSATSAANESKHRGEVMAGLRALGLVAVDGTNTLSELLEDASSRKLVEQLAKRGLERQRIALGQGSSFEDILGFEGFYGCNT